MRFTPGNGSYSFEVKTAMHVRDLLIHAIWCYVTTISKEVRKTTSIKYKKAEDDIKEEIKRSASPS
jgi:hypothetical protein